ncbi:MAG: homoserine dehydrogenase [Candidatus Lokiarchaeota archaeon]|nr:homoserine dehydrogenase [Candidatus Lokiarchaeota archaeon]
MDVKIGLIGKGNVGSCFLELLKKKENYLHKEYNLRIIVIAIYEYDGALINEKGLDLDKIISLKERFREHKDWKDNIKPIDSMQKINLDLCIDTTPTNPDTGKPALNHIIDALNNHIDVISSSKGPFYLKYKEIHELAKKTKTYIKYEATVASCVPILSIKDSLNGNEITSIKAILNGTSNYILSRMTSEGVAFSVALKEAQELGYAEADPTLDIEGYDAAGKLVILANELLNWSKTISDVKIKGISKITPHTIELAKLEGFTIKHLAIAEKDILFVEPRLIEKDSPLNIGGTLNVIKLQTKYAGPIIIMGRGAGGYEAASAILNDLISIQKLRKRSIE